MKNSSFIRKHPVPITSLQGDIHSHAIEEFVFLQNPYDQDDPDEIESNRADLVVEKLEQSEKKEIEMSPIIIQSEVDDNFAFQEKILIEVDNDRNQGNQQNNEIDEQADDDEEKEEEQTPFYNQTYYKGTSWLAQILFIHIDKFMRKVRREIISKKQKILIEHLPQLEQDEHTQPIFEIVSNDLKKIRKQGEELTVWKLSKIVLLGVNKWKTIKIILFNLYEAIGRCFISILMSYLIDFMIQQRYRDCYLAGMGLALINFTDTISRHNAYYINFKLNIQVRMVLLNLVYHKLTDMNAFSIKGANMGKIINIVSGDFNLLEYNLALFYGIFTIPVALIFASIILCVRFNGAIGLMAILILALVYPFQIIIQKLMAQKIQKAKGFGDQRLKLTNEFIEGIRLIKMYAWEEAFEQIIKGVRMMEFRNYIQMAILFCLDRSINSFAHIWGSFIFFAIVHYGRYAELNGSKMVSTIQLMSFLGQICILMASYALQGLINVRNSFQRIIDIIDLKNNNIKNLTQIIVNNEINIESQNKETPVIRMKDFTCYWTDKVNENTQPALSNLNIELYNGSLVAVVGKIGSGKSSFLQSLITEIPSYKGSLKFKGIEGNNSHLKIAYVEQEPFIFPDTIRKNVLFGRAYNSKLYDRVIFASSLIDDLAQLVNGDQTEIGERGTNLSGGQRARVSLARALYQMADLYLFDDPLSAVDAKVARNIFNNAIIDFIFEFQPKFTKQPIKPLVILATHQVQYAIECDFMIVLNEGKISAVGRYSEIQDYLNMVGDEFKEVNKIQSDQQYTRVSLRQLDQEQSISAKFLKQKPYINKQKISSKRQLLYQKEEETQTQINFQTYIRYFLNWKPKILVLFVTLFCLGAEATYNLYTRFIALYDTYNIKNDTGYVFKMLGTLVAIAYCLNISKYLMNSLGIQSGNLQIHTKMIESITKAPVSFFDTNPSGRIINRFSTDLSIADFTLNPIMLDVQELLCYFLVSLLTIMLLQPWFGFAIIFTIGMNFFIYIFSKDIITQSKECDLIQRSPLFDLFKKTLSGVVQIRLYKQEQWFRKNFFKICDKSIRTNLNFFYTQRAFGFNIDFFGQIASTIGIFIIISSNQSNPASFIQALLLLLTFNDSQQWCLRQLIQFSASMNSMNRIFQIIDLESEQPHKQSIDQKLKFQDWPTQGQIEFRKVHLRYRKTTDLVLKDMNFKIQSGTKVGCVGRTGAGKSSILQALFRMCEIDQIEGSMIKIDDQDISQLGLNFLRSSISIIPQIPFVFSGTIRRNLDPLQVHYFNFQKFFTQQYTDDQLWSVLEETRLKDVVKNMKNELQTDMTDVNSVFSVGEKQLICLARTILSKKKIIVLDEATANVDMKTDEFIQSKIRQKFQNQTIITIAHRLNTIADYDYVMVIDAGKVAEYGKPFELLCKDLNNSTEVDQDTLFAQLVRQTGKENSQVIMTLSKSYYIKSPQ